MTCGPRAEGNEQEAGRGGGAARGSRGRAAGPGAGGREHGRKKGQAGAAPGAAEGRPGKPGSSLRARGRRSDGIRMCFYKTPPVAAAELDWRGEPAAASSAACPATTDGLAPSDGRSDRHRHRSGAPSPHAGEQSYGVAPVKTTTRRTDALTASGCRRPGRRAREARRQRPRQVARPGRPAGNCVVGRDRAGVPGHQWVLSTVPTKHVGLRF